MTSRAATFCLSTTAALLFQIFPASAGIVPFPSAVCGDIMLLTVRGSGDKLLPINKKDPNVGDAVDNGGSSVVHQKFFRFKTILASEALKRGKKLGITKDLLISGGKEYRAVNIDPLAFIPSPKVTMPLSIGMEIPYASSAQDGAGALVSLANFMLEECPNAQLLLVGHSQGGQVISTALTEGSQGGKKIAHLDRVAAVTFGDARFLGTDRAVNRSGYFGDGNYYAPDRDGIAATAIGAALSSYGFGKRDSIPYEISSKGKFISVCHSTDYVCQADLRVATKYGKDPYHHGDYAGFIEAESDPTKLPSPDVVATSSMEAAMTIREILSRIFPRNTDMVTATGPAEFIFVVDITVSMDPFFANLKRDMRSMTEALRAQYGEKVMFGIVGYGDEGTMNADRSPYITQMILPPTNDPNILTSQIDTWSVPKYNGNPSTPEAMYAGIRKAIDVPWATGLSKNIIVFSDAGNRYSPSNPESAISLANSMNANDIRLYGKIYSYDPEAAASIFNITRYLNHPGLVIDPGGTTKTGVRSSTRSFDENFSLLSMVTTPPPVADAGGSYTGYAGSKGIYVSGERSYDPQGSIVSYLWDVNGDGQWECNDRYVPSCLVPAPATPGTVEVTLRVENDQGAVAQATTTVNFVVSPLGTTIVPVPPTAPTVVPLQGYAKLSFATSAEPVRDWELVQKNADGTETLIGYLFPKLDNITPDISHGYILYPLEGDATLGLRAENDVGMSEATWFTATGLHRSTDRVKPVAKVTKLTVKKNKVTFKAMYTDNAGLVGGYWKTGTISPSDYKKSKGKQKALLRTVSWGTDGFTYSPTDTRKKLTIKASTKVPHTKGTYVCVVAVGLDWGRNVNTNVRCIK